MKIIQWLPFVVILMILLAVISIKCAPNKSIELFVTTNEYKAASNHNYFLSLKEALNHVQPNKPTTIFMESGVYFLDEPIRIDSTLRHIQITSLSTEKPIILGGKQLIHWEKEGQLLVTHCTENNLRLLEVNGRMAERSRLPEEGTFRHLSSFDSEWLSTLEGGFYPKPTDSQLYTMIYDKKDIGNIVNLKNAEITLYHMWDETLVRMDSIDSEHNMIRFQNPPAYPPGAFGVNKYVLWNTMEGLTHPGQWYLDRTTDKLYYWPLKGEDINTIEAFVPIIDTLIALNNTQQISLSNLEFRLNTSPLQIGGFGCKWFPGAISFNGCKNLTFKNLSFSNLSTTAIKGTDSDNISIINNHISHTGAGGIRLIGSNNVITGNQILHTGRIYPSSIALYINVTDPNAVEEWEAGNKEGNVRIEHNEISDAPYVAIACGGHDARIMHNKIDRVMQVLSDGGGIYVTFCENLWLKGNYVYDIPRQEGYGTCAYYLDEMTSHARVEDNLSVDVARAMHNHLSENNTIKNNVFVNNLGEMRITFHRCNDFELSHNIFIAKDSLEIKGINVITKGMSNFLYSTEGKKIVGSLVSRYEKFDEKPIRPDSVFILQDPQLMNTKGGKVDFHPESPALIMGIKALDVSSAGVVLINNKKP